MDVTHRATGHTTTLTAGELIAADESSLFGQRTFTEEEWETLLEEEGIAESSTDPVYYPEALHEEEDEEVFTPSEAEDGSPDEENFTDRVDPQDKDGFPLTLEGIFDSRWVLLGGCCLVSGGGLTGSCCLWGWYSGCGSGRGKSKAWADCPPQDHEEREIAASAVDLLSMTIKSFWVLKRWRVDALAPILSPRDPA
ncbi:MAG: hypothetical protein U5K99_06370 [Anaerolineales bacterium]|nr:hypothetical protein [Anaerolineales bacterium]